MELELDEGLSDMGRIRAFTTVRVECRKCGWRREAPNEDTDLSALLISPLILHWELAHPSEFLRAIRKSSGA